MRPDQEHDGTVNKDSAEGVRRTFDALPAEVGHEVSLVDDSSLRLAEYIARALREQAVQTARDDLLKLIQLALLVPFGMMLAWMIVGIWQ